MGDASVTIEEGALVTAAEDILLKSESDIKAYNYANSGMKNIPVALALTVVSSDVDTSLEGKAVAGRKVHLFSTGEVKNDNRAARGVEATGSSGGFAALTFVNQDVDAVIDENAEVTAGGDVAMYTRNIADVNNIATSSMNKDEKESPTATSILKLLGTVLGPVVDKIGTWLKGDDSAEIANQIEKTIAKVAGSSYSVKIVKLNPANEEKGSATVTTKLKTYDRGENNQGNNQDLFHILLRIHGMISFRRAAFFGPAFLNILFTYVDTQRNGGWQYRI